MKLKRKIRVDQPDYPSFDDYMTHRDTYRRGLSLTGAALLASGAVVFGAGCSDRTAETSGPPVTPANEELRLKGDIAVPAKPLPKPVPAVMVGGGMSAPEPSPKPLPPPPPPALRGRIKAPRQPVKPDSVTPPPLDTPKVDGKIVQPAPPVPPKATKGIPPPPEPPAPEPPNEVTPPVPPQDSVKPETMPTTLGEVKIIDPPRMRGVMMPPKPRPLPEEDGKKDEK